MQKKDAQSPTSIEPPRQLPAAAVRALEEAAERRRQREGQSQSAGHASFDAPQKELGGRKGPDPVRYGDWENGGIASDF